MTVKQESEGGLVIRLTGYDPDEVRKSWVARVPNGIEPEIEVTKNHKGELVTTVRYQSTQPHE